MPEYLGGLVLIPEPTISGVYPYVPDFDVERRAEWDYVIHRISLKKEQRIRRRQGDFGWKIAHKFLQEAELAILYTFYDAHRDPLTLFYFYDPKESGGAIDPTGEEEDGRHIVRFKDSTLDMEAFMDLVHQGELELIEVNTSTSLIVCPGLAVNVMGDLRRPSAYNFNTLLRSDVSQADDNIHVLALAPASIEGLEYQDENHNFLVADRRCQLNETFGPTPTDLNGIAQPRLMAFDVRQEVGGSDSASFVIDDADGVMSAYARLVDLEQAVVKFLVLHNNEFSGLKLFRGYVVDWHKETTAGTFTLEAVGGIAVLNQVVPSRILGATCPLTFDDARETTLWGFPLGECPYRYVAEGGDANLCDKSLDGAKGCLSHAMHDYFQGFVVKPMPAFGRLPGGWFFGLGHDNYQSLSTPLKTVMGQTLPLIYGAGRQIVPGMIFEMRDESEFLTASAVVGEGTLTIGQVLLDGLTQHFGFEPVAMTGGLGPANLDQKNPNGPRGTQIDPDFRSSRICWVCVRRTDEVGLKNPNESHDMKVEVLEGMPTINLWRWTGPFLNGEYTPTSNPVRVALDLAVRGMGIRYEPWPHDYHQYLGSLCYIDFFMEARNFCEEWIAKIGGEGNEQRYTYRGVIKTQKPAIDHVREMLVNVPVDLVWYYGALGFRLRRDESVNPPWWQMILAEGENIIDGSFQAARYKPEFNELSFVYSDIDYDFNQNEVSVYDEAHQLRIGFAGSAGGDQTVMRKPLRLQRQITLTGAYSRSQLLRLGTQLLREELGGRLRPSS